MEEETKIYRNSNIELLRLVLIVMVIILHFNNETMGGAFKYVKDTIMLNYIFHFMESISICAVNCFMIISGSFLLYNNKIKMKKILDILLIVVFYKFLNYLLNIAFQHDTFTLKKVIYCCLPGNYFAIFYCITYLLSPYLSKIYEYLDNKKCMFFTNIIVCVFILIPTLLDFFTDVLNIDFNFLSTIASFGNGRGYTVIQFITCLSIGMCIRKCNITFSGILLIALFVLSSCIMTILYTVLPSVYNYCSILPVLNAVCLFLLFEKVNFYNSFINYLAKSVFSIFCIHTSGFPLFVWRKYCITENHFSNTLSGLCWLVISVCFMFVVCLFISIIFKFVFRRWKTFFLSKVPEIEI